MTNPHGRPIHGHCGPVRSPTYISWISMKLRVKRQPAGYKGVTMDPRWESFETFLLEMGTRPAGHDLDRIDPTQGYFMENCRWLPASENRGRKRR